MDGYSSRRKRQSSARERQMARMRRKQGLATPGSSVSRRPSFEWLERLTSNERVQAALERLLLWLHDTWWYIRHNPRTLTMAVGAMALVILLYLGSFWVRGRIFPNVQALDVSIGGMSVGAAEEALQLAWSNDIEIALQAEGETFRMVRPAQIGLVLDARATALAARDAGARGFPFGHTVTPVVELDAVTAQRYLIELASEVEFAPQNARYNWRNGVVIGVRGSEGRMLNINLSLDRMIEQAATIARERRFDLLVTPLSPEVIDPEPLLDQAQNLVEQSVTLRGYDPFTNQQFTWPVEGATLTNWLEAAPGSLTLREEVFVTYVDALNDTLNPSGENTRYLSTTETIEDVRQGIQAASPSIDLRIRYRQTVHTIVRGDTMFGLARQYGVPYFLLLEANVGIDPNVLSVGDEVIIPTRDVTMENDPVPEKRIIVDLESQYLVAFENGQVLYHWPISSGVASAPTSPGIYQILSHEKVAYGSSNTLCNSAGLECGVWEMNWFMGIYRVQPELINGFHGSVLLPNGGILGGGAVGYPTTFGCVMSEDSNAIALFEWAEIGTVVEIINREFAPMSDLGQAVLNGTWRS